MLMQPVVPQGQYHIHHDILSESLKLKHLDRCL